MVLEIVITKSLCTILGFVVIITFLILILFIVIKHLYIGDIMNGAN